MESNLFFEKPILNSPYEYPARHWELDADGQPTQHILNRRRPADFITPIPKSKKQRVDRQIEMGLGTAEFVSTEDQQYDMKAVIDNVRRNVDAWRMLPSEVEWRVTPETARLLKHWRTHKFHNQRPFFCQVEAIETLIWLTEVAPQTSSGRNLLEHLENANTDANPELSRLALKLATGAGKTTVMAMMIVWQTINAARYKTSKRFSRGFLIVTPGLTIRDRLRVLLPNDPENYYVTRELVPPDLLPEVQKAKVVITNYHAFKLRERVKLSRVGRSLVQGREDELNTLETEGQMIQRVMGALMGMKNIMAINDEAHHCYREKVGGTEEKLKGEERQEAERNKEAARVWISGLEAVNRQLNIIRVVDLSATPFFLSGSGYVEGTLFPWTMSDFSLMDAIECGIVKLPRVPVADNITGGEMPMFRKLWDNIRDKMPRKGRSKAENLSPVDGLPTPLLTAIDALYGHYKLTFDEWRKASMSSEPCFIIVCNNTSTSKLIFDYVAGYEQTLSDGSTRQVPGKLELFRNTDENGNPVARPRTLLIDSEQLESGEALDAQFHKAAEQEIARFKQEVFERTNDSRKVSEISDQDILREVMNTVGKPGTLGDSIRCVVSVSMLTEGWDANTVTHILGVRAFGTQLLCEQVIGRALRRQCYELNQEQRFDPEYADILGIPFDFTAKPVVSPPQKPRETYEVKAVKPERDSLEIRFPRVRGYRVELSEDRVSYSFNEDSRLRLTPELVGATETVNSGIIGMPVNLTLAHTADVRPSQVSFELTTHLVQHWRDDDGNPRLNLFNKLRPIVRIWIENYLECVGGTYPAQLKYKFIANLAAERIKAGITRAELEQNKAVLAVVDVYNPIGSTSYVNFTTSRMLRWRTDSRRCHVNWAVLDSDWEAEFCRVAEKHPRVRAYVKNSNLGFEVPYLMGGEVHTYIPDFILQIDDGRKDPLNLVVEVKGYRGEDAIVKKQTMDEYWVPGVNNLGSYGRWAFVELTDVWEMEADFADRIEEQFSSIIEDAIVSFGSLSK